MISTPKTRVKKCQDLVRRLNEREKQLFPGGLSSMVIARLVSDTEVTLIRIREMRALGTDDGEIARALNIPCDSHLFSK